MNLTDIDWSQYDFIDFGCGTGGSTLAASANIGGRGVGIERNPAKVELARQTGADVVEADMFAVPDDAYVRFATFDNVLEHLPDLHTVRDALAVAHRVASDFVYIRHPSFDDEAYLRMLGLKQYWTDWTGHPAHVLLTDFLEMFRDLGFVGVAIHPVAAALDSADSTILPLSAGVDQHEYEYQLHGAKSEVAFDKPCYYAYDIVAFVRPLSALFEYRENPKFSRRHPKLSVAEPAPLASKVLQDRLTELSQLQSELSRVTSGRTYRLVEAIAELRRALLSMKRATVK